MRPHFDIGEPILRSPFFPPFLPSRLVCVRASIIRHRHAAGRSHPATADVPSQTRRVRRSQWRVTDRMSDCCNRPRLTQRDEYWAGTTRLARMWVTPKAPPYRPYMTLWLSQDGKIVASTAHQHRPAPMRSLQSSCRPCAVRPWALAAPGAQPSLSGQRRAGRAPQSRSGGAGHRLCLSSRPGDGR